MQRWKLIIIFTRPGDNYRPTVPERRVRWRCCEARRRSARHRGRNEHFGALYEPIRYIGTAGEWGGRGRSYRISRTRIAALLTLFAVTPCSPRISTIGPLAVFAFCEEGVVLDYHLDCCSRARADIFSQPAWQTYPVEDGRVAVLRARDRWFSFPGYGLTRI